VRSPTIRRLALIAFFLAAGGTHPLAAQTIDTIVVDNHNIFEPGGEPLPLGRGIPARGRLVVLHISGLILYKRA